MLYFDVDGLVVPRAHDERFVNHTFVFIQEGEYHVKVDEGFRAMRQFLNQNVLHPILVALDEFFHERVDGMRVGTAATPDDENVFTGDLHVTAFDRGLAVNSALGIQCQCFSLESRGEIKNGLHDDCFPVPNGVGHTSNEYLVVHTHGGVTGEEEIMQGA